MFSVSEKKVMQAFRDFGMTPNKMLCFFGQDLDSKAKALESLVNKEFLIREKFGGAYSLTTAGYAKMKCSA